MYGTGAKSAQTSTVLSELHNVDGILRRKDETNDGGDSIKLSLRTQESSFIHSFICSYYPRGYMISVRASTCMSIFYLCFHFFSGLADFRPFFYPLFLRCFMFLVCLLRWCIPMCALSGSCLLIVLPFAFLLFQPPFWAFSFVLWIFGILIDNDPPFLFRIHIGSMVCSFCRSGGGSGLVHSGLSVVVRFLPPSFVLRFHCTVLGQSSCVFLSWYVVVCSQF